MAEYVRTAASHLSDSHTSSEESGLSDDDSFDESDGEFDASSFLGASAGASVALICKPFGSN